MARDVSKTFFFSAFCVAQYLVFLSSAQIIPQGIAQLWRYAASTSPHESVDFHPNGNNQLWRNAPLDPSSPNILQTPLPQGNPQLWRNAPPPVSPLDSMHDPMITARGGSLSGLQKQQTSPYGKYTPNMPTNTNPSLSIDEEPPILNGICNVPSFNPCVSIAACTATVPVVGRAVCVCPPGYGGDGKKPEQGGEGCINIDECRTGTHNCDSHSQECVDVQGSFYCKCKSGFSPSPSGKICLDIDECQNPSLNNCDPLTSICHNLEGSFRCDCNNKSTIMDEETGMCRDLDECNDMGGVMNPCEQLCVNKIGGVSCGCSPGYRLREDGRTCEDINECLDNSLHQCDTNGVISRCVNTVGGYTCECNNELGYKTAPDGISCMNLDECYEFPYVCGGALSCCKDLIPPQRFACSTPLDDNALTNPSNLNAAIDAASAPVMDAYTVPYGAMSAVPVALSNFPNAVGTFATGLASLPLTGTLGGFEASASSSESSHSGDEIGGEGRRRLQTEGSADLFEEGNEKKLKNTENYEDIDDNYVVIVANNLTPQQIQQQLIESYRRRYLQKNALHSHPQRNLQILSAAFRPRLFEIGNSLLRPPQLVGGGGLLDLGTILGPQAIGTGGGAGGGLRIGRGNTCPYGFTLGADMYRTRVRENTKQIFKSAITSRMSSEGENSQLVQPEYFTDGLVENTKVLANEFSRWYTELSKLPMDVMGVASDHVADATASTMHAVSAIPL